MIDDPLLTDRRRLWRITRSLQKTYVRDSGWLLAAWSRLLDAAVTHARYELDNSQGMHVATAELLRVAEWELDRLSDDWRRNLDGQAEHLLLDAERLDDSRYHWSDEDEPEDDDWSGGAPKSWGADTYPLAEAFPAPSDDHDRRAGPTDLADANRGFQSFSIGRTGAPVGRPHRGTKAPGTAEERLLNECPGHTIQELRRLAGARGKPSAQARASRRVLERAVYCIREAQTATPEALAGALECSVRTIHRLRDAGAEAIRLSHAA